MLRLAFDFIITWRETRTRPNAYVLRVANTFMSYFFKFGKLQIYNIKRRLSRGGGNMADLGAGFDETWCKI